MAAVPGHTVEELVQHWSATRPDTPAFVSYSPATWRRRALSRLEVHVLARKFAARLRQAGVGKGDVVCVALPNCLERVVVDLGTVCSGAVALNGQVARADGEDFIQALKRSKAKAVVLDPDAEGGAWSVLKRHVSSNPDTDVVKCPALPDLRRVITCRRRDDDDNNDNDNVDTTTTTTTATTGANGDFLTELRAFNRSLQRARALETDVAVIWTTSGSTGFSKLVPQTHANIVHIALQVLHISGLKGGEPILNCAPLGWAGGYPLWFLASGATRVFLDMTGVGVGVGVGGRGGGGGPRIDMAAALWECVQREKCVYVFASPVYVSGILERQAMWQGGKEDKEEAVWRPRGICLAGQPMKKSLVAAVVASGALCQHVDINYGTTECGVLATARVTDPDLFVDGLTGRAAPGTELRVVDADLNDVGLGEVGEVLARSPALHGVYLDSPDAARRAFTGDGWFRTDDVGYFLPDRQLVHLGRRGDAITRGAYLCYPGWLESLLRAAPGVRDVCVVPVPDPVLHHEICACVVPAQYPPSDGDFVPALRAFADSQLLTQPGDSQHMAPKFYVVLPALPLTPTGKVNRQEVCALAGQELGSDKESGV